MVYIPFIYFLGLEGYLLYRHKRWGMDLAAVTLLLIISFFAIRIDNLDLYGDYGINEYNMTLPTVLLYCIQWTVVVYLLSSVSYIPLRRHEKVKTPMLYVLFILLTLSSVLLIVDKMDDIRNALIMDMADVKNEYYKDLAVGARGETNWLLFIPSLLVSGAFPTLALIFWFYMKTFMKCYRFLELGIIVASIVQAVLAIVMAGRAALVYWCFDFFMIFSFFYPYMTGKLKRSIVIVVVVMGTLIALLFVSITFSRFDVSTGRDPFESIYGYAGQQVNNFCAMFEHGGNAPFVIDREFPLLNKVFNGETFDLADHYTKLESSVPLLVNVFDTFGAEVYLDMGWIPYILLLLLLGFCGYYIKERWTEIQFYHIFILAIIIAFFTRGLFAWPFTGHYTTIANIMMISCCYLFKYVFKV